MTFLKFHTHVRWTVTVSISISLFSVAPANAQIVAPESPKVEADTPPVTAAPEAKTSSVSPEIIKELERLLQRGDYDQLIRKATPLLQDPKASDPQLRYLRGRAAHAIGFFGMAQHDFSLIGDYKPHRRWPSASEYVRKIEAMKALAPKNIREVKSGKEVIFRVYYDKQNLWTDSIIKLLPQAYAINYKLLKSHLAETPVYLFSDYERFKNFYALNANGTQPASWVWAAGKTGGIYFCQSHPTNTRSRDVDDSYFRLSVAHEFNHCLVGRMVGGAPLPNWFSEGLAMQTSPQVVPSLASSYDKRVKKALESNQLLTMKAISQRSEFRDSVESQDGSDAYAQGYSMTTFLLSKLTPEKLTPFLEDVRENRKFDESLLKFTDLSPDEFYDSWLAELTAK